MILISLWTQTDFGGIFKIIQVYKRYDGANKMQIEQLNNTELFLKLFHIQCKEIGKQQNLKNGKVSFRLNTDVRKELEDSRLKAIECLKTDYVRKRSTEF